MVNTGGLSPAGGRPVAVIDLGSNSVLLLVLSHDGRVLRDLARITRLGQGVFGSGSLDAAARERTREVVRAYAGEARALGASPVVGVGTEALRRARDGARFLEALRREGLLDAARVLGGEEEAELAIEATRGTLAGARPVAVDVGGGSTELAWIDERERVHTCSLPLGSVRLTEALVRAHPVPSRDMEALRRAVERETRGLSPLRGRVVALAGTATTLAALDLGLDPYDPGAVEGHGITLAGLAAWVERLAQMSVEARLRLPGLEPGRADVIVAGLVVLHGVLARIGAGELQVSGRGMRYGLALRLLEGRARV